MKRYARWVLMMPLLLGPWALAEEVTRAPHDVAGRKASTKKKHTTKKSKKTKGTPDTSADAPAATATSPAPASSPVLHTPAEIGALYERKAYSEIVFAKVTWK